MGHLLRGAGCGAAATPQLHFVTRRSSVTFGSRVRAALDQHGPLCAGIDPHGPLLAQWGLQDDLEGLRRFTAAAVEAFAGSVAAVKPQSAFFERFGAAGVGVLEE